MNIYDSLKILSLKFQISAYNFYKFYNFIVEFYITQISIDKSKYRKNNNNKLNHFLKFDLTF